MAVQKPLIQQLGSLSQIPAGDALGVDQIQLNTALTQPAYQEGRLFYDQIDKTLAYYTDISGITVNLGQEQVVRVVNKTGQTLNDGQLVYIDGAQGQRPSVALAIASTEVGSESTIGMVTNTILNNAEGYITTNGLVHGLDTSAFTVGFKLYLSPTVAGTFTQTQPVAPNHATAVGYLINSHPTQGSVFVNIQNGLELSELHDVLLTAPSNGQVLTYETASGIWKNKTPTGGGGGSVPRTTNVVLDFLDEQNIATIEVADTGITASSIIQVIHSDEDLGIQGVNFSVTKVPGVSYTVTGYAPHGASGQYAVTAIITEGA